MKVNGKHLYYIKLFDGKPRRKDEDEEFRCDDCDLIQTKNWCFYCNTSNTCEVCVGYGGDYGGDTEDSHDWVCQDCFDERQDILAPEKN